MVLRASVAPPMSDDLPEPLTFRRLEIRVGERPPDRELRCRVEPDGAPDLPCAPFALPLADGSCSEVFFRHGIQYFARPDAVRLLRECWRVLAPGGSVYLIAPNLD